MQYIHSLSIPENLLFPLKEKKREKRDMSERERTNDDVLYRRERSAIAISSFSSLSLLPRALLFFHREEFKSLRYRERGEKDSSSPSSVS